MSQFFDKLLQEINHQQYDLDQLNEILPGKLLFQSMDQFKEKPAPDDASLVLSEKKLKRIRENIMIRERNQHLFDLLTKREKQVIGLLVNGFNNPKIAEHLNISRATVEQHRKNIRKKLNYPTDYQLFRFAQAFDLDKI